MKRTEIERIEREVKRVQKREEIAQKRKQSDATPSVAMYISQLYSCFRYDENEIFNTQEDLSILEVLEGMQANIPSHKWDDVLRKAIKKAGIKKREKALGELKELISSDNLV